MSTKVLGIVTAVLVALAVVSTGALFSGNAARDAEVSQMQSDIDRINLELETAQQEMMAKEADASASARNMDSGRMSDDSSAIYGILEDMCTWDTVEGYQAMRDRMLGEYGISADSWLATAFLPVLDDDYKRRIKDGGLNMRLNDADIRCISASDGTYTYFVQAEVESSYRDQDATSLCAFTFAMDGDGHVAAADGMLVKS